jgi:hypothetical protein
MKSSANPFQSPRRTTRSPSTIPAGDGEDERDRHVRRRLGQHIRRIGQHNALRARVGHIEVVVAHGDVRDDLEIAASINDVFVDLVQRSHHDRVLALDAPH